MTTENYGDVICRHQGQQWLVSILPAICARDSDIPLVAKSNTAFSQAIGLLQLAIKQFGKSRKIYSEKAI